MNYYEAVLKYYKPNGSEDERRAVLTDLAMTYGVEHIIIQLMVLYRYICHKRVSYNILADVQWIEDVKVLRV